jgi:signal transduction histidine kinase
VSAGEKRPECGPRADADAATDDGTKPALPAQYAAALREYCATGARALPWPLQPSLLGLRAASEGLGALELAAMHQKALVETLLETLSVDDTARIALRASEFVAEALAPLQAVDASTQKEGQREWLEAMQRVLDAAIDQLLAQRRAEQRKYDLICVMTHEMHGSLSVLMSELGAEMNARRERLLDVALRNSERMMGLVGEWPEAPPRPANDTTFDEAGSGSR